MKVTKIVSLGFALAGLSATGIALAQEAAKDELMEEAQFYFVPIPKTPPALPGNELTPAKAELGRMLFFDPRLSKSQVVSCNSCHVIGLGGADWAQAFLAANAIMVMVLAASN